MLNNPDKPTISIVTPCFNESDSILSFLEQLTLKLGALPFLFNIVVVDDCSYDNTIDKLKQYETVTSNINFHVITLKYNAGHQQAIFQGLLYLKNLSQSHTIIMDSDGEDDPNAIELLVNKLDYEITEVKRGKRNEGLRFNILYFFYKKLFKIITGKQMDFGNFCMIKYNIVERIQLTSFIHLPAYLLKQKAHRTNVLYDRNKRIMGQSKMGYKNLLLHAFKSFIEFGDDLLLWFLRIFSLVFILLVLTSANLIYQKFISQTAILGWFSTLSLGLINLAILCLGFFIMGILLLNLIHNRSKDLQSIYTVIKKPL
ncbi:MAG: glycosyltransferase [Bacteroidota bacterium]